MEKILFIIVLLTVSATTKVHSLQCYVCDNCETVTPKHLKTCDTIESTTNAPGTTTLAPTVPGESSTSSTPGNNTTTPENNSTTSSPGNNTATPENNSTTSSPGNNTATPENNSTTSSPENNTATPENNSTTSSPGNNTETPENNSTTSPPGNNTATPENNLTTSASDKNAAATGFKNVARRKRSVEQPHLINNECACENGKCDCPGNRVFHVTNYMSSRATVMYQCFKHVKTVNGSKVVQRGCQAIPEGSNATACTLLNATTGCKHCNTDKCNSASGLQFSFILIAFAFSLSFV